MGIKVSGGGSGGISTPVSVANGGTAGTDAQTAIDTLTNIAGASSGNVLTYNGSHAVFAAPTGGYWTEAGSLDYLSTTANKVAIGRSSLISTEKVVIDGSADIIQTIIRGNATQTANIFEVRKSDNSVLFGVTNAAGLTVGGSTSAVTANGTNSDLPLQPNGTGNVTVSDGTDTTKILSFELSGATTAKTLTLASSQTLARTVTLPDATDTLVGKATTDTLTNKRVTKRIGTVTSSATPTINTDNVDMFTITALALAITSMTTNLSGTPTTGQSLIIRFLDNGTARGITWGASFASRGATLPTTTILSKYLYVGFLWNEVASVWDCISTAQE